MTNQRTVGPTVKVGKSGFMASAAPGMFEVKYFYLATGMEGHADERGCGLYKAASAAEACDMAALAEFPTDETARRFFRSCLSATPYG